MLPDMPLLEWADYMLPTKPQVGIMVDLVQRHVESRKAGNNKPLKLYIDGPTGTGKTALARLVASKLPGAVTEEIDGSQLKQHHFDRLAGNAFCWRVLIVNEAQNITDAKADKIMSGLDSMGSRACVIFTTMRKGSKANPLFAAWDVDRAITDRCLEVNLTNQGIKSPENVAKVLEKAKAHGLDYGADTRKVENLFEAEQNSIRGVLAAISRGALAA
jgi:replication-associated recombination protein RarA